MKKLFALLAFAAIFSACKKDKTEPSTDPAPTTDFREKFSGKYYVKVDSLYSFHRSGIDSGTYTGVYYDTVTVSYTSNEKIRLFDIHQEIFGAAVTIKRSSGMTYAQVALTQDGHIDRTQWYTGSFTADSINIEQRETHVTSVNNSTMRGTRIK